MLRGRVVSLVGTRRPHESFVVVLLAAASVVFLKMSTPQPREETNDFLLQADQNGMEIGDSAVTLEAGSHLAGDCALGCAQCL